MDKFRRYGKTYGRYNCAVPCIVTMDTELIKSVTVRNFDCFYTFISEEVMSDWCWLLQGDNGAQRLLFVDSIFEVPQCCPTALPFLPNLQLAQAESGRQWNN